MPAFVSRLERFAEVDSTQRVVVEWLVAGTPEVAVALADVQTAGRGRHGRRWDAPPGAALLCSCGFLPGWLAPRHAWRLPAIVSLAMLDAAEEVAGLRDGTLGLKWPNDLVVDDRDADGSLAKLAGVLGETTVGDAGLVRAVVGIGVNVEWAADRFPPELGSSISSLSVVARRPVDREQLLAAFLARLEPRYEALRTGRFDSGGWSTRQRTTDRLVEVESGGVVVAGTGAGVDPDTGALLLSVQGVERAIDVGEVTRCRVHT